LGENYNFRKKWPNELKTVFGQMTNPAKKMAVLILGKSFRVLQLKNYDGNLP
jgi:hypothetical protein